VAAQQAVGLCRTDSPVRPGPHLGFGYAVHEVIKRMSAVVRWVKHIVMWNMKGASPAVRMANAKRRKREYGSLMGKIQGLV
jgi:hypothetical protein